MKLTIFPFCSSTDGGKEKKEKNIAVNMMLIKSFKKGNENNSHDDDCDDDNCDGDVNDDDDTVGWGEREQRGEIVS